MFNNDVCDARFKFMGLAEWDYTWVFDWINGKIQIEECIAKFMDILRTTPEEWRYKIENFSLVDQIFLANTYNPLFWFAEWTTESVFFKNGQGLGTESAPSDMWMDMFGDVVYGAFYRHLVYTARPVLNEIKWRYDAGLNALIPDWLRDKFDWLEIPDVAMINSWIIGFEPECIGVQMGMWEKIIRAILIVVSWIMWLFLVIVRFIELVVYFIVYWLFQLQGWFIDLFISIHLWIQVNIFFPIYNLLLPVINFFWNIHLWLMWLIMLPINWLLMLWAIIWDFFLSIKWNIFCFFLWLHDWLWSIYWIVWQFLWDLLWPIFWWIIQILWFIPMWLLYWWYYLMRLIWEPLDQICVNFFLWIEENIVDPILEISKPEWEPSWFELGLASPIFFMNVVLA